MTASATDTDGYLIAGDALRGFAALAVLVFHGYLGVAILVVPLDQNVDWGLFGDVSVRLSSGLYVFFALSGYLVGGPWVRAWLLGDGFPRPLDYLGRRARRIVPAFWVVGAALLLWFGTSGAGTRDVLILLAFGQVFLEGQVQYIMPQGWSLDIELMFYLALPVLAGLALHVWGVPASARTRRRALVAFLAVAFVGGIALRAGPPDTLEQAGARNLFAFAWAFVPGLALAAIEPVASVRLKDRREGRRIALALGALGTASFGALVLFDLNDGRLATLLAYAGCGTGFVGGALAWQWATGAAPRGLDNRVVHALGRWSYGIYLIHVGVGVELIKHVPEGLAPGLALALVLGGMLAVSIPLAALLWWIVEKPAITGRRPRRPRLRAPGVRSRVAPAGVPTPTGPSVAAVAPTDPSVEAAAPTRSSSAAAAPDAVPAPAAK